MQDQVVVLRNKYQLGQALRWARCAMGLTQRELGILIGSKQSEISDWENGVQIMRLETAWRVLPVLGLDVAFIPRAEDAEQ